MKFLDFFFTMSNSFAPPRAVGRLVGFGRFETSALARKPRFAIKKSIPTGAMGARKRRGISRSLALLGSIACLVALWLAAYLWVGASSRDLLYRQGKPAIAAARLESWSPWMLSPKGWRWLLADAYRKIGDRGRVKRITDELATGGMAQTQAAAPLLLMDSAAGVPVKVKENLGPLLLIYKENGAEVLGSLVQGFMTQGDFNSANQTLRLWGELFEGDFQLEFWKGVTSTANYDLDGAITAFQKSIAIRSDFPRSHEELAQVYLEKAQFEEARTEFEWIEKYAKANGIEESPELISGYARSLLNLGYPDLASEQLKKLKDISKLPSPELALVCETNLESGNVQEASEQAAMLLKRWPDALPYLQLQARCMAKMGNSSESDALFQKASDSQLKRPDVDRMLERLVTDNSNQDLRRDMGEMMMNYLDPSGGAGYVQVASRANPIDLKSHALLANYFEREGRLNAAENHRRAIRQIELAILESQQFSTDDPNAPSIQAIPLIQDPSQATPNSTPTSPNATSPLAPTNINAGGNNTAKPPEKK